MSDAQCSHGGSEANAGALQRLPHRLGVTAAALRQALAASSSLWLLNDALDEDHEAVGFHKSA